MSKRRDLDFLRDIEEAIERIERYTSGMSYTQFLDDTQVQDAVLRNMEVIGEATKNLSWSLRERHSNVPWKKMAGLRDKLIHHYFGVDFEIVWTTAQKDLPQHRTSIRKIKTLLSSDSDPYE